jgi:acyl transferase domain-containing protein/NADPH:quinone reductase-like Zn-dependent oxidoreductase
MVTQTNAREPSAHEPIAHEPIAIVGIGCRLPGRVDTPAELWQALAGGLDAIREVPADRWDAALWVDADAQAPGKMATRWGGFLDDVAGFDAEFFGISPAEARQMDPQQRLALEVAWAAVEDARLAPASLAGSRTGVYLGAMWQDYPWVAGGGAEAVRVHSATGWDNSVISARIAYALGLRGPAMTVGTASSSSLVAVHLAVQSLRSGETDAALVGGVNLMLHPHSSVAMTKLGTQSPDGRCRAFDAGGNGYVRGEGCGVVVLRRLSDALADEDRIYAVVHGSAVNNDGATGGLTEPSAEAQVEVLRAAWADAGVSPREVAYSEAHGTGTPLGDVIEAAALGKVFGDGRTAPLRIGSAKTNFGHLEAAAGILGLLKAALAIHHGRIPPSLHFETPNPNIDFAAHQLRVATVDQPWPDGPRFAGVSSFGFGGTNAHVALGQPPLAQQVPAQQTVPGRIPEAPVCLVVSGKTERALARNAARLADHLRNLPDADLVDVAYSLATTRTHFGVRGVVVGSSVGEVVEGLDGDGLVVGSGGSVGSAGDCGRVVFVFPGQGAQWWGMGRDLLRESEVFREAVAECDKALTPHTGWSVVELLSDGDLAPSSWGRVDVVQPVLFAVYVGLAAVWRSWGVEPDAVVGHSQGEVAAAVVCGALSVEDGARVVALRSRAVRERGLGGAMAVVERPVAEVAGWLGSYGGLLSVAVVNSARSTVVAGDAGAVERFVAEMGEAGVFCQRVGVDYASHSAQVDVVLPGLLAGLAGLRPRAGAIDFYSSVTGEVLSGSELDAGYWCRNLREAVRFDRAVERLRGDGFGVFIEVSPHPVLGVVLADAGGVSVGSLRRDRGGVAELLRGLGSLHVHGVPVDWGRVFAGRGARRVDVPTYGFQRQRYWLGEDDDALVTDDDSWRAQVAALPEPERLPWLTDLVARQATTVLGRSESSVRPDVVLREQGFDSLTLVELRNRLVARTGAALPAALAYDYPTPRAIAGLLLARAGAQPAAPVVPTAVPTPPPSDDTIAIVAMGCRLPGGIDTPEAFWELLSEGREAIGAFPARWDQWSLGDKSLAGEGGFLRDAEFFDASFFGISPRQARSMDPQQRIVLEVVWEALERANIRPESLAGTRTGVYLGAMSSDYDVARRWDLDAIDGDQLTGNASSVISGRVAYTLGLEGPALTVDTACSSSLVALHLAGAALRSGECDVALAGGVTVMSTPQMFVEFSRLGGLAPDGRCKSFSDRADGTGWSEGCGILVLKRLSAAERDGDRVLAVVRGTAINQDGRSQGLTAPNGLAQQRVLRDALAAAQLTPADIDAVEAHGTGTVLGDPIEAGALAEVFSGLERPVYLGSAKSNLGHAQAAAGVVGVMKMVLALQHELLPETLRANPPTTHVDWASSPLELLLDSRPWRRAGRVRRAGVSSFGMSGTNAHVIIEEAPAVSAGRGASRVDVPTYNFQRQRYWLDRPEPRPALTAAGQLPAGHPWLGTMTTVAGSPGSYLFSGRLSLEEHPWLADHAVSGQVVVPGAGLLDVALSVARSVGASAVAELTLLEPLVLTESAALRLQVTVGDSDARGRRPFTLHSQPEDASEPLTQGWRQHVTGELADTHAQEPFETLRQWPVPGTQAVDISDFYSRTRTLGLAYGPAFQGLREFARQGGTEGGTEDSAVVYGRVRLPESLNPAGYSLHPALLDAALHVIVAELLESSTDTRPPLPFIWSDVQLYRAAGTELRVRAEIADSGRATLWLADADGAPVARIGGLRLQRADFGRSALVDHLYRVDFEAVPLPREDAKLTNAIVLGDATLADALGAGSISDLAAFFDTLDAGAQPPEHLILTTLDDTAQALRSVQRWLAEPRLRDTQLTWLTHHAVSSGPDDQVSDWSHAALWGLARSTRTEQPERTLRLVDLDSPAPDPGLLARIIADPGEPEWAIRGETALVPRARQVDARDDALTVPDDGGWYLDVRERGRLDAFTVARDEDGRPPAAGEVRVEIRAAGVNFRDVLNALDLVPAPRLGLEYAGVVREVGAGVEHVRPGDRVMGMATGTFGSAVRTDASRLVRIPDALTFAEAATIPVAFVTALYALDDLAALRPGERVLVHAAAGGVGMAAVRLARLRGAEVFATASPGKWPALRALGLDDAHIRSSRDTGFEAGWLSGTDGRGMDVVLNSLAGEFTDASLRLLPRGGRFLDLGKTDPRSPDRIAADHPGVAYRAYDVTTDIAPERIGALLSEAADLLARGELPPLPYRAYDVRHTPHALRHMQQAKHVGKLVVTMPRALDPDGTVLITGGLGELGGALAAHLVRVHGVRRLVLCSRRGADAPTDTLTDTLTDTPAAALVRELKAAGAEQVRVVACDVTQRAEVAAMLADVDPGHPWTAVFHLAGVLDDGLVTGFTEERLRRVMAPKVLGARHLDELTERLDLAAFVLFSSVAGTLGTAGQSGYAAANAALDALAARRRNRGLPAVSLAFGLWEQAGVGMTAHLSRAELGRLRRQGIGSLSPAEGLRALDHALTRPEPYLVPVHLELASLRHALGDAEPPAVLRALVGPRAQPADVPAQEPPPAERTAAMPESERLAALVDVVRDEAAAVLGLSGREGVARDRTLRSLGIDSLTMIELRKRLSRRANVTLPATLVFDYPTAEAIAGLLLRGGVDE